MDTDILFYYLGWNKIDQVQGVLDAFDDINILYRKGVFFEYVFSKNNVKIFEALMAYFENTQFPKKNKFYKEKKKKLTKILENLAYGMELSSEMKKSLSKYIDFDNSSIDSRENDFDNESFSNDVNMHNDLDSIFPTGNETDISSKSTNFELTPGDCSCNETDISSKSTNFELTRGDCSCNETDFSSKSTNFELTPGDCSSFCDSTTLTTKTKQM
ncbi:uncharacterized protein LOC105847592 isoform X1 [Hydra vulgaris]|uniref:uncharacterized protein LOC105847592 isoform X1 n=1 Tax=Hydra vulgaris TaxID=6087 RepID=UPI0032E9C499